MKNETIKELNKKYVAQTYAKKNVILHKGKGASARDYDGKKYIDMTSGIGVNALGYADKGLIKAVKKQLKKIQHTSNNFYQAQDVTLAEKLCDSSGMKKAFLCNSGAEANEGAIKWARAYGAAKAKNKKEECYKIITLTNSFHGRTVTTLAATGQDNFHKKFQPLTEGFVYAESNDIKDTVSKFSDDVCAIMLELVQGEGGVNVLEKEYVREIAEACNKKDILLIIDEVQTGIGRTGTLFAYEQYGIKPDIITLAKGLGGGLPVGAILLNNKAADILGAGDHGSTFGGNPVSCAAANYILDKITPDFLKEVNMKADYIKEQLKDIKGVTLSGLGLMIGISKKGMDADKVLAECAEKGLLVLTAKTKVRLLPPLNITKKEVDEGLKILAEVIESH